ncbi:MAG: uracil-DNA glycosylase, partial [Simkaniaceae bacterium]|nr:uracil-DNA glycosylase [Simkaniaceae bacterium]
GISPPIQGDLTYLAKQGVLLLNATLTVRKGEPKSHFGKGWETFTDTVIEKLCLRKDPVIFLLWGKVAEKKCLAIPKPHQVVKAAHPSPFSVHKFFGCRHFSKVNQFLISNNNKPINWFF